MTHAPEILLEHHLKRLKLPTVLRTGGQALKILQRVCNRHAATAFLARNANQHFVAMLRDVDSDTAVET